MKRFIVIIMFLSLFFINGCMSWRNFDISYELNGGEFTNSEEVTLYVQGNQLFVTPNVTKEGYDLVGWYLDSSFTTVFDPETPVTENLTLYAKWQIKEFLITFYTDEEYENLTLVYGTAIPVPEDPDKEGYTFEGWYYDEDCTDPLHSTDVVEDITNFYAKWEAIDYVVTYHLDGNVLAQDTYHFGENVDIMSDMELTNERYVGTYFSEEYVVSNQADQYMTMPSNNLDLYILTEPAITNLRIGFAGMRNPDDLTLWQAFGNELKTILNDLGYPEINTVTISFFDSFEIAESSLLVGEIEILYAPSFSYIRVSDNDNGIDIQPVVSASNQATSKTLVEPNEMNDGLPEYFLPDSFVPYYQSLIIAGVTPGAKALADKVNAKETLIWDDIKGLDWCVTSQSSLSSYIYPNFWLYEQFGHTFDDIEGNIIQVSGYSDSFLSLAMQNCDLATTFMGSRILYETAWTTDFMMPNTIWEDTDVIAIAGTVMRELFMANTTNFVDEDFLENLKIAIITASLTDVGYDAMITLTTAFVVVEDSDYDPTRSLNDFIG